MEVRILKGLGNYYGEFARSEARGHDGRFGSLRDGLATSDSYRIIAYRYCLSINYYKWRGFNQIAGVPVQVGGPSNFATNGRSCPVGAERSRGRFRYEALFAQVADEVVDGVNIVNIGQNGDCGVDVYGAQALTRLVSATEH